MNYEQLTINQKISLKGYFQTDRAMYRYGLVMMAFGFKKAIEYFLNDDLNAL